MSANESRPEAASMNSAVAAGSDLHSPTPPQISHGNEPWRAAHEARLRVWSEGFNAAWDFLSPRLARAEADANRYYYELNNGPEIRARHAQMLKAFDVARARKSTAEKWAELDRIAAARSAVSA